MSGGCDEMYVACQHTRRSGGRHHTLSIGVVDDAFAGAADSSAGIVARRGTPELNKRSTRVVGGATVAFRCESSPIPGCSIARLGQCAITALGEQRLQFGDKSFARPQRFEAESCIVEIGDVALEIDWHWR